MAASWFESTMLGENCCFCEHCEDCEPNGVCHACNTVDGRFMDVVNTYASTCDGCSEMTDHHLLIEDKKTQLGYCWSCWEKWKKKGEARDE